MPDPPTKNESELGWLEAMPKVLRGGDGSGFEDSHARGEDNLRRLLGDAIYNAGYASSGDVEI